MEEIFISELYVEKARVVKNLLISLSDKERKHLIITGKNGSGKTSLLLELNKCIGNMLDVYRANIKHGTKNKEIQTVLHKENTQIKFINENTFWEKANNGTFIIVFFDARRQIYLNVPSGINKINLQKCYNLNEKANQNFIQYIVNLKADRSFAKDDGEDTIVSKIDNWFDNFQKRLREIFDSSSIKLVFDKKNYNFQIIENEKEPYTFNTLSDGYSAIFSIVTELLLRMEAHDVKNYDMEGLVLIDEIETHLHVDLQKKVLPFLIDFFPKIQFIVTTHSPFVLSSVSNSVICDIENKIITSDLSAYSYDAIIESYFNTDKYSNIIKSKIIEYENLLLKEQLDQEKKERLKDLENYFKYVPKYLSNELLVKLQEISLKSLRSNRF